MIICSSWWALWNNFLYLVILYTISQYVSKIEWIKTTNAMLYYIMENWHYVLVWNYFVWNVSTLILSTKFLKLYASILWRVATVVSFFSGLVFVRLFIWKNINAAIISLTQKIKLHKKNECKCIEFFNQTFKIMCSNFVNNCYSSIMYVVKSFQYSILFATYESIVKKVEIILIIQQK